MAPRKPMSERDMEQAVNLTREALDAQPKVKVKLHLDPEEKKRLEAAQKAGKEVNWPNEFAAINGYAYNIPRGIEVEVPQSIAEVLRNAGLI